MFAASVLSGLHHPVVSSHPTAMPEPSARPGVSTPTEDTPPLVTSTSARRNAKKPPKAKVKSKIRAMSASEYKEYMRVKQAQSRAKAHWRDMQNQLNGGQSFTPTKISWWEGPIGAAKVVDKGSKWTRGKIPGRWKRGILLSKPGTVRFPGGGRGRRGRVMEGAVVVQPDGQEGMPPIAIEAYRIKKAVPKTIILRDDSFQKQGEQAAQLTGECPEETGGRVYVLIEMHGEKTWQDVRIVHELTDGGRKKAPPKLYTPGEGGEGGEGGEQPEQPKGLVLEDEEDTVYDDGYVTLVGVRKGRARLTELTESVDEALKPSNTEEQGNQWQPPSVAEAIAMGLSQCQGSESWDPAIKELAEWNLMFDVLAQNKVAKLPQMDAALGVSPGGYLDVIAHHVKRPSFSMGETSNVKLKELLKGNRKKTDRTKGKKRSRGKTVRGQCQHQDEKGRCTTAAHCSAKRMYCLKHAPAEFMKKCKIDSCDKMGLYFRKGGVCDPCFRKLDQEPTWCRRCELSGYKRPARIKGGLCRTCIDEGEKEDRECTRCHKYTRKYRGGLCNRCMVRDQKAKKQKIDEEGMSVHP